MYIFLPCKQVQQLLFQFYKRWVPLFLFVQKTGFWNEVAYSVSDKKVDHLIINRIIH